MDNNRLLDPTPPLLFTEYKRTVPDVEESLIRAEAEIYNHPQRNGNHYNSGHNEIYRTFPPLTSTPPFYRSPQTMNDSNTVSKTDFSLFKTEVLNSIKLDQEAWLRQLKTNLFDFVKNEMVEQFALLKSDLTVTIRKETETVKKEVDNSILGLKTVASDFKQDMLFILKQEILQNKRNCFETKEKEVQTIDEFAAIIQKPVASVSSENDSDIEFNEDDELEMEQAVQKQFERQNLHNGQPINKQQCSPDHVTNGKGKTAHLDTRIKPSNQFDAPPRRSPPIGRPVSRRPANQGGRFNRVVKDLRLEDVERNQHYADYRDAVENDMGYSVRVNKVTNKYLPPEVEHPSTPLQRTTPHRSPKDVLLMTNVSVLHSVVNHDPKWRPTSQSNPRVRGTKRIQKQIRGHPPHPQDYRYLQRRAERHLAWEPQYQNPYEEEEDIIEPEQMGRQRLHLPKWQQPRMERVFFDEDSCYRGPRGFDRREDEWQDEAEDDWQEQNFGWENQEMGPPRAVPPSERILDITSIMNQPTLR